MSESPLTLARYDSAAVEPVLPVVHDIYATVFGEPPYGESPDDIAQWRDDLARQRTYPNFELVLASLSEQPAGFIYGYRLTRDMARWPRLVEPVLPQLPAAVTEAGQVCTIMEFGVLANYRRAGVGRALHDALLISRLEPAAILTVRADATPAQRAYTSWGWQYAAHRPRIGEPGYDVLIRGL